MVDRIVQYVLSPLIYLLVGIALVVFLWGAVEFIANADKPDRRLEGQKHLFWGIIGLAIIFGSYGILNLVKATILDLFK